MTSFDTFVAEVSDVDELPAVGVPVADLVDVDDLGTGGIATARRGPWAALRIAELPVKDDDPGHPG